MSRPLSKKTSAAKLNMRDPDIETLQERLLKSLTTAFDPTAATKSDDFFLAQDYSLGTHIDTDPDPFKQEKNSYREITEKARAYVEKAQVEKPVRNNTAPVLN